MFASDSSLPVNDNEIYYFDIANEKKIANMNNRKYTDQYIYISWISHLNNKIISSI